MTKEVKIIPREIHLFHIDVVEISIKELSTDKSGEFKVNVAHTIMHNLKEQRLKIGLNIELNGENHSEEGKANFVIDFHFHIDNLKNFYSINEQNKPVFSGLLVATLLGLSFSTARGIIFERLAGTSLKGMILPVVDPKMILQQKRMK